MVTKQTNGSPESDIIENLVSLTDAKKMLRLTSCSREEFKERTFGLTPKWSHPSGSGALYRIADIERVRPLVEKARADFYRENAKNLDGKRWTPKKRDAAPSIPQPAPAPTIDSEKFAQLSKRIADIETAQKLTLDALGDMTTKLDALSKLPAELPAIHAQLAGLNVNLGLVLRAMGINAERGS